MTVTNARGFTLIELVLVMVLVGILAGIFAPLIARPVEAFFAEARRGQLVDTAQVALDRMSREIRLAVPNSVRVDPTGRVVEFLRTIDGGRYRTAPNGLLGDSLNFSISDTSFDVIGNLATGSQLNVPATCAKEGKCYVVVGNEGPGTGADAFNGDDIASINQCLAGSAIALDGSDHIVIQSLLGLLGGKKFPQPSPNQRFQIVDTPVTYLCDPTAGTLRRYDGYTIMADQSDVDTDTKLTGLPNPAESSLMGDDVAGCSFSFDASASYLLTASLTLSQDGEQITLLKKVRVENQP